MQKAPPTPKGFRDIDPELAQKRRDAINKIVEVLEEFEFSPIETPTIEFASTLKGKYGEEERLIYQFTDRGGRELALRYDLTVPLARYVATNNPKLPFRRYQIGQVFRGENPQHGRYREFTQFDFDSVGGEKPMEENALIIEAAIKAIRSLGLQKYQLKINSKETINNIIQFFGIPESSQVFIEMDKVGKKDKEEIDQAIVSSGIESTFNNPSSFFTRSPYVSGTTISGTISPNQYSDPKTADILIETFRNYSPPPQANIPRATPQEITAELNQVQNFVNDINDKIVNPPENYKKLEQFLFSKGIRNDEIKYERTLVRGLNYYTDVYFELKPSDKLEDLTIGSGGRYDNLIGMFAKKPIPAVGFSFGLDRLIEST